MWAINVSIPHRYHAVASLLRVTVLATFNVLNTTRNNVRCERAKQTYYLFLILFLFSSPTISFHLFFPQRDRSLGRHFHSAHITTPIQSYSMRYRYNDKCKHSNRMEQRSVCAKRAAAHSIVFRATLLPGNMLH